MRRALFVLAAMLCAAPLMAQQPDTPQNIKAAELDLSVPSSPAFAVLGLTPDTIIRPASPRALAVALLNGVDSNNTLQTGVAIDAAPYFLANGRHITLELYEHSPIVRFLSRLQLSVATAKAAADNDKAVRASAGVKLTFWDRGDYRGNHKFREDLSKAHDEAVEELKKEGAVPSIKEEEQLAYTRKLDERIAARTKVIRERYRQESWNNSAFVIGAAPTWITETGLVTGLSKTGGAAWASLAYGFENVPGLENSSQLIIHARYRSGDLVPNPDVNGEFYTQSSTLAGARFRFGAVDTNVSVEAVYLHARPDGRPVDNYARLAADAEHRIVDNIWLHFAVGGESGRIDNRNHLFVLTTLKFSVGDKKQ